MNKTTIKFILEQDNLLPNAYQDEAEKYIDIFIGTWHCNGEKTIPYRYVKNTNVSEIFTPLGPVKQKFLICYLSCKFVDYIEYQYNVNAIVCCAQLSVK